VRLNTYETVFISNPEISEDEERTTVDSLRSIITDRGGTIHIAERLGRRRLSYPIRKFDDGVYTRLLYDSETDVPKELDRRMRLSDRVLRSLTVRLEHVWAKDAKEQAVRILERQAEDAARAEEEARRAAEAASSEEGASGGDEAEAKENEPAPAGAAPDAGAKKEEDDKGESQ
jgi:small subunit ribosomal protein S6